MEIDGGQKCLMILGMHRSYTSMVAAWLRKCGLDIGEDLLAAGVGNEFGHFEDNDFLSVHESILQANGLPPSGLHAEGQDSFAQTQYANITVSPDHRSHIEQLVRTKPMQFGWKDPRTCLFLDTYRELLPAAHSFVLVRHYDQVVESLIRRDRNLRGKMSLRERWHLHRAGVFKSQNSYLGAWIHYNRLLLEHIELTGCPVILDPIHASKTLIDRITEWGFDLEPRPIETVAKAPGRARGSAPRLHYAPALEREAARIFERLSASHHRIG